MTLDTRCYPLADPDASIDRAEAMRRAMDALADPEKGPLLAWLVASGRDPFPDASETGLSQLADTLARPGSDPEEVRYKLMLIVLGITLLVGRYTGYRLTELRRFRDLVK